MKKLAVLITALLTTVGAFAYGDYGYSSHSDEISGFAIFTIVVMIAYIILSVIFLVRWWKMTTNVDLIRQNLTHANPKLTYLVLIGEKEQAKKAALTTLVDLLYPIYKNQYDYSKAESMNKIIENKLPRIAKLGIELPDYVSSGEKFIDYVNELTGNKVTYKGENPNAQTTSNNYF